MIKLYNEFITESIYSSKMWVICEVSIVGLDCKDYICKNVKQNYYHFIMPYNSRLLHINSIGKNVYPVPIYAIKRLTTSNHSTVTHATNSLKSILDIDTISDQFVDYLDFSDTIDEITYLPIDRIKRIGDNDPYNNNYRQSMKIGRFFNRYSIFDSNELTIQSVEKIVDIFKSVNFSRIDDPKMEIVSGEHIRKWYDCTNNSDGEGQLNKSCMRYSEYGYKFDIYVNNPDVCKMVILKDSDNPKKIIGRALLWETNNGLVMDRIYTINDHLIYNFIGFASKNNYILKDDIKKNTIIKLKDGEKYLDVTDVPFFDTFKFYNPNTNELTNSRPKSSYDYRIFDYY